MADDRTVLLIAKLKDEMTPGLRGLAGGTTALAAAVVGLTAAAFAATVQLGKYGAAIYDSHTRTGIGIQDAQALAYAFEQTGGSASSVEGAVRAMTTAMRAAVTEGSEQRRAIDALGLSYQDLLGMNHREKFIAIANALGQMTDETERDMAAQAILGRQYQNTISMIEQAGGNIDTLIATFDRLGLAISDDQITALKNFDSAMLDVNKKLKVFQAEALTPLIPVLMEGIDSFMELAKEVLPALGDTAGEVGELLVDLMKGFQSGVRFVGGFDNAIRLITSAFVALKLSMLASAAACGTTGVAFISTGSIATTFNATISALGKNIGPMALGAAIAFTTNKLMELYAAMNNAEDAAEEDTDAVNRMNESMRQAEILTLLNTGRFDENAQQLRAWKQELEAMALQTDGTARIIQTLTQRIGVNTTQTARITSAVNNFSEAERSAAIAIHMANLALLEQWEAAGKSGQAMTDRIARIREEIEALKNLDLSTGDEGAAEDTGGSIAGLGSDEDQKQAADALREKIVAVEEEARRIRIEEHQRYLENVRAKRDAELERINQQAAAEAALAEQAAAQQQAYLQNISDGLTSLFVGIATASDQGRERLAAFFDDFKAHLLQVVASKAFQMAFDFLLGTGGGGGGILGFIGGIFGKAGGGIQPGAAGGRMVTGGLGIQGDKFLVPVESGERIQSREEVRNEDRAQGGNQYTFIFQPTFSTASRADAVRFGKFAADALRRNGVIP